MKLDVKEWIAKVLNALTIHSVTYTGTTDTVGVFAVPVSVFNPSTMNLLDVLCLTAGYYAEGKCIYNGQLYVRIIRYDGQSYTSGSATVEVSYINK